MQDSSASPTLDEMMALVAAGQWSVLELIGAAQLRSDAGDVDTAITLYQHWLQHNDSPLGYAVRFNLAVNFVIAKRLTEAEQLFRDVIREAPEFVPGHMHLCTLLERTGRNEEALQVLRASGIPALIDEANRRASLPRQETIAAINNVGDVLASAVPVVSLSVNEITGEPIELPCVSILIPTHNRPDYFEIALKSALHQTYKNIQIVVSDNSDDEKTRERITPYLIDTRIVYHREPGLTALNNFAKCIELASGDYINFLMDDDVFHPDKIRRMMHYFLKTPDVGLVTSFRQLIDEAGNFLPPASPTERLFPQDTLIKGQAFGEYILKSGRNVLGEPTTVLVRREDIGPQFGIYFGRQFIVLADVAAWLSVLAHKNCVYITDALSYFRIHAGQDQKNSNMKVRATLDWFRLFMMSHQHGVFLTDRSAYQEMLAYKLNSLTQYVTTHHAELRGETYNQKEIYQLIADAMEDLLTH